MKVSYHLAVFLLFVIFFAHCSDVEKSNLTTTSKRFLQDERFNNEGEIDESNDTTDNYLGDSLEEEDLKEDFEDFMENFDQEEDYDDLESDPDEDTEK